MDQTTHFKLAHKGSLSEISFALFQAMEVPQAFFFFFLHSTGIGGLLCSYAFPLLQKLLQYASGVKRMLQEAKGQHGNAGLDEKHILNSQKRNTEKATRKLLFSVDLFRSLASCNVCCTDNYDASSKHVPRFSVLLYYC